MFVFFPTNFPQVKSDCSNLDELPTLYFELDGAEAKSEVGPPQMAGLEGPSNFHENILLGGFSHPIVLHKRFLFLDNSTNVLTQKD